MISAWRGVLVASGGGAVVLAAELSTAYPFTTAGGVGPGGQVGFFAVALGLLVAALLAPDRRGVRAGRWLAVAAGLGVLPEWTGWAAGPGWARTLADATRGPALGALVVAVLALVGARGAVRRGATVLAVTGAVLAAASRVLLTDPFDDPDCWQLCAASSLSISAPEALGAASRAAGASALAVAAVLSAVAWLRADRRRISGGVAATLLVPKVVAALAALAVTEDPRVQAFRGASVAAAFIAPALAVTLAIEGWRDHRRRTRLHRVVEEVLRTAAPGTLEPALRGALADPSLEIAYWSPARDEWVGPGGEVMPLPLAGHRATTVIERHGEPVARLDHRPDLAEDDVERVIGPAVRLSIEHEQLRAALLAELIELQASRSRIVEQGDDERRQLERNLHDGVQQRIVGLGLLLRAMRAGADGATDRTELDRCEVLVASTLDELRRLAHGIHPAVLTLGGLAAAVPDLGESSKDMVVRVARLPGRLPSPVESAAYLVVAEALAQARRSGASTLLVDIACAGGEVVVQCEDDAPASSPGPGMVALEDRIGALDGRFIIDRDGHRRRLQAVIPCGS